MWNIEFDSIALIVLFLIPLIRDFLKPVIKSHIKSWSRKAVVLLKFIYWAVLFIPLIIGLVDNQRKNKAREQEVIRSHGITYAEEGRLLLHEGLKEKSDISRSQALIENALVPLREAIKILNTFPFEYNMEIRARHDLALALERLSYKNFKNGCEYPINNKSITAKRNEKPSNIDTAPKRDDPTIRCTDFDFADAGFWHEAEYQYNLLYEKLINIPEPNRENITHEFPAAARSTGYFYLCNNLRAGGNSLDKAQNAFKMVADLTTSTSKLNLPGRHNDANNKLQFLDVLSKTHEADKAQWISECKPKGSILSIPQQIRDDMVNVTWHKNLTLTGHKSFSCPDFDTLALLLIPYYGFDGNTHQGEMIVTHSVASDVLKVFQHLYAEQFPIERMGRLDKYKGDDRASMAANNTSAFSCRLRTDGNSLSEHSYGTAIDINPKQNPFVKGTTVLPPDGKGFLDRSELRPGMVEQGSVRAAFQSIGWSWGGDWKDHKDYQHFSQSGE